MVKRRLNDDTTFCIYDGERSARERSDIDDQAREGSGRNERERMSQKPILEIASTGDLAGWNIYGKGIGEILMRAYGAIPTYYFQHDRNGNVTHLTKGSGTIVEKYKYDAFGVVKIYNGSGVEIPNTAYNNRFLFIGREYAATYAGNYIPAFYVLRISSPRVQSDLGPVHERRPQRLRRGRLQSLPLRPQ
jgi:hypothetical protein